ncbi:MAG TPA: C4-type zinc ribbon domain-containing protein [Ilumatobacter sp.]|nr:C4-type zinc ribbon domain-containing protein [Ilumatobacter sp.]
MTHPLIELQAADTMSDQLRHRRENLAERDALQNARNALVRWDQARTLIRKRIDELSSIVEASEHESADIDKHRTKLQAQLRTVIAPREAEALQREIAGLNERRSQSDDAELAAMEEQARLEADLAELLLQEPALRQGYLAADAVLAAATRDIEGELTRIADRLASLRAAVDKPSLTKYDRLREHHVVAAAVLVGSRCDGCHMDLSAAEVDTVRDDTKVGKVAECPQCGRMLVA